MASGEGKMEVTRTTVYEPGSSPSDLAERLSTLQKKMNDLAKPDPTGIMEDGIIAPDQVQREVQDAIDRYNNQIRDLTLTGEASKRELEAKIAEMDKLRINVETSNRKLQEMNAYLEKNRASLMKSKGDMDEVDAKFRDLESEHKRVIKDKMVILQAFEACNGGLSTIQNIVKKASEGESKSEGNDTPADAIRTDSGAKRTRGTGLEGGAGPARTPMVRIRDLFNVGKAFRS